MVLSNLQTPDESQLFLSSNGDFFLLCVQLLTISFYHDSYDLTVITSEIKPL